MLSDMRVLVTGASGFIGSNIANALAAESADVIACDWFGSDERWRNLQEVRLEEIVAPEELLSWLARPENHVDAIIHMGAISATTELDVDKIVQNNVRLSLALWDYCRERDVSFVYASSAATYGDGSRGFSGEDGEDALARLNPLNAYGWSKHVVDRRIAADVARGRRVPRRWAGLKFYNVYGPRERHKREMRSVVHQIWQREASGGQVRLFKSDNPDYPDGGQLRDFIHVDDCVHVVRRALESSEIGGIFDVGTGRARTFHDLALAVFKALGKAPSIEFIEMPEQLRGRYQYFTQANTARLVANGLAPNFRSLEEGVANYVDWLSAHPGR